MFRRNLIYVCFLALIASINLFAQSQDPPTEEDLKRKIIIREYTDVSDAKRWEIKAQYPELILPGGLSHEGFRIAAKEVAMKEVETFKKNMGEFTDEDRSFLPDGVNYTLDVGYSIEFKNEDFVSISYGISDYSGGAHPNHWTITLNYDLKNNKALKLTDLFKPKSNFLSFISSESIKQITKAQGEFADADWIEKGAGKDIKNFESWNITKAGLKFYFDPYQVGPYAAGGFETIVPYKKFKSDMQSSEFYRIETVSYTNGNPSNWCRNGLFTDEDGEYRIAQVKGNKNERTYFYGDEEDCPDGENCRQKAYLIAGDEVIVSKTYGDFSCVWFQPAKGNETVGWIQTARLTEKAPVKPGNIDWIGEWTFYDNSIKFIPTRTNGKYLIKGNAFWKGVGDNIHIGELDFSGTPEKHKLEAGDGEDQYDCRVKMQRVGKYLIVSDNKMCGGVNVTFDGVYIKRK